MKQEEFTRITKQMTQIFEGNSTNQLARRCRFLQRERKIEPFKLMLSMISSLGSGNVESIADLQRSYNYLSNEAVAYKPFHNQLSKPEFAHFMRESAEFLLGHLVQKSLSTPVKGAFSEFERLIIQDGSSFAVHDQLQAIYPGRFTKISPAAIELHVTYDLLNEKLEAVNLTEDTAGERTYLPESQMLENALLMADAGYFSRDYIAELIKSRTRFIVKADCKINPIIEKSHTPIKRGKSLLGMKLKSAFSYLSKQHPNDLTVQWCDSNKEWFTCRLIVSWSPKNKLFQFLVTNLPRHRYQASHVINAYRLRWQIELLFKEWKSYANLKKFNTTKPQIVEGLIWASLMAATLKRYLAICTQRVFAVEISTRKVAMCAVHVLQQLIIALIDGKKSVLASVIAATLEYFKNNAKRAHKKRDRLDGRLKIGLSPCFG